MSKFSRVFFGLVVSCGMAMLLGGCAHPIQLTSDINKIPAASNGKIAKTAAYVISAEDRARQVTTAGGGGDKVSYFPYRDLEPGVYKALSQVFDDVVKLDSEKDQATIAAKHVSVIVLPQIETSSSSDSLLTWPPTQFNIYLNCKVQGAAGEPIALVKATGQGNATFSEFTGNFSLSAQRSSEAALADLVKQLSVAPELRR